MAFTKNRDWVVGTDGEAPISSQRHGNKTMVVLDGPDGEYFGWEDDKGRLFAGSLVTPNAAKTAAVAAGLTELSDQAAIETAHQSAYVTLKAKREAGTDLTMDDLNMLADLFFKLDLS